MSRHPNSSFDVIVIGVGSMGAPTCYFLAKRGYKVLGIEQFGITHELGSHTGQSRIIRKAYFEHSDYVPLMHRAYENWKQLEAETGEQIYYQTGLVYFGQATNEMMLGVKRSAELYNIPLDQPGSPLAKNQFPSFTIPGDFETLFEPEAGFLRPEKAIQLYVQQAIQKGACIHTAEKVTGWEKEGNGMIVRTGKQVYRCAKLVITAGAWSGKIIPTFNNTIRVTRQFIAWIKPKHSEDLMLGKFPCWLLADDKEPGCYYGFPILPKEKFGEPYGLKIAHHYPAIITDPDHVNRDTTKEDIDNIRYAMNKYLPDVFDSIRAEKTCLYGNTPDENFIIDTLPTFEDRVAVACGFSGHGFKFASAIGEILADLATDGKTLHTIGFLSAKRFL